MSGSDGPTDDSLVVDAAGHSEGLSTFLTRLLKGSELGVAEIARRAHLSRSFLYLLMDDEQVPSVESLVAVFEAAGCEDVRAADPGEPGEISFWWDGQTRWVRLPRSGKRAARSRSALRTLNSSHQSTPPAGFDSSPSLFGDEPVHGAPVSAAPAPRRESRAAHYEVGASSASAAAPADRQRLLGELLESAGDLDPDRLRLLVEHARLLRRG